MPDKGFLRKLIGSLVTNKPKKANLLNKETQVNQRRSKNNSKRRQQKCKTQIESDQIQPDLSHKNLINHLLIKKEKNNSLKPKLQTKLFQVSKDEKSLSLKQHANCKLHVNKYTTITIFRDITFSFILNSSDKDFKNIKTVNKGDKMLLENIPKKPKLNQSKITSCFNKYRYSEKAESDRELNENSNKHRIETIGQKYEISTKIKMFKNKDEKVFHELVYKLKLNRSMSMKESKKTSFKHVITAEEENRKIKYKINMSQVKKKKVLKS